ncbi:hypothetical protein ACX7S9_002488 [Morganella morganii]|uniref:hypothetical protein n=1 Tax=Morganella morganii TaxID=582 RepID=UPI0035A932F9
MRFIGYFRRSAPNTCLRWERPRRHPRCCGKSGESATTSSVFCLTTTPSATSALLTQRPPQLCQQATGFHCPLAAGAAAGVVCAGAGVAA